MAQYGSPGVGSRNRSRVEGVTAKSSVPGSLWSGAARVGSGEDGDKAPRASSRAPTLWSMNLTTRPLWDYSVQYVLKLMEIGSRRVVQVAP
jgi:hypothetical protein